MIYLHLWEYMLEYLNSEFALPQLPSVCRGAKQGIPCLNNNQYLPPFLHCRSLWSVLVTTLYAVFTSSDSDETLLSYNPIPLFLLDNNNEKVYEFQFSKQEVSQFFPQFLKSIKKNLQDFIYQTSITSSKLPQHLNTPQAIKTNTMLVFPFANKNMFCNKKVPMS